MTATPSTLATPCAPSTPAAPDEPPGRPAPRWLDELLLAALAAATWIATWSSTAGPGPVVGEARAAAVGVGGLGLLAVGVRGWIGSSSARVRLLAAVVVVIGGLAVGSHRGAWADEAHRPRPPGPLAGLVTVLGDPEPVGSVGWRVELRLADGGRIEATAYGRAGAALAGLGPGWSVQVEGRVQPVGDRPWLRVRHVVARASLSEVEPVAGPGGLRAVTEWVRQRIGSGGDPLSERPRALYHGLVLGDDRFQPMGQRLRFRLVGLSHLLAVSGQNVAFVLAAAGPVLRRLGPGLRLPVTLAVLILFAVITRLEPSVLRAVGTAALSTWAAGSGRARSGSGVLAVVVTVLLWADPFLVHSVGFQLSVAASGAILVLAPVLAQRLAGPPWLTAPLAVSLAAQAGVAPIVGHHFGPMSLVAIPANLAAGWAAGLIMIWGMTLGVVAGLLPGGAATAVQAPVAALLWWLETVAAIGSHLPGPRPGLAMVAALAALGLAARARPDRWSSAVVVGLAAVVSIAAVPTAPERAGSCGPGMRWFPGGPDRVSVLVVGDDAWSTSVEQCRKAGIRRVDLVVAESGGRSAGQVIAALGQVMTIGSVRAPPQHAIVGATRILQPVSVAAADRILVIEPDRSGRRLLIDGGP